MSNNKIVITDINSSGMFQLIVKYCLFKMLTKWGKLRQLFVIAKNGWTILMAVLRKLAEYFLFDTLGKLYRFF